MNIFKFLSKLFSRKPVPANIEIDDSGSGSLYGGVIILVTDGIINYYGEVPLKLFAIKDKERRNKSIRKEISRIIQAGLDELNARAKKTTVTICQGSIFNKADEDLKKKHYTVNRVKIEGRTNSEAEVLFTKLLSEKYGINNYSPKDYKKENLRQYEILRERRDFKNVKMNVSGVSAIYNNRDLSSTIYTKDK